MITRRQSGDTIVEVLLATVVLSIVLAGAYTLSNKASRLNQQAFERTKISYLLQQQSELTRAARDAFTETTPGNWGTITSLPYRQSLSPGVQPLTECDGDLDTVLPASGRASRAFYIDAGNTVRSGILKVDNLYHIWAEIEGSATDDYWNVHVFGCWEALGNTPNNVTSIVLRLEDPQ